MMASREYIIIVPRMAEDASELIYKYARAC